MEEGEDGKRDGEGDVDRAESRALDFTTEMSTQHLLRLLKGHIKKLCFFPVSRP